VFANGKRDVLNVGPVLILPEGFELAPPNRIPAETKEILGALNNLVPFLFHRIPFLSFIPRAVPSKKEMGRGSNLTMR
jgi:hypothetical protein